MSAPYIWVTLGAVVARQVDILNSDGVLTDPTTLTLNVTDPAGAITNLSGTVTVVSTGVRKVEYTPLTVGRYIFKWRTTVPTTAVDDEFDVAAAQAAPVLTLAETKTYLGTTSWTDPEIQDALDAELAAQLALCRTGPVYPADLRQALKRRVARNLAMRALPVGIQSNDTGATYVGGRDPEIRRLEAPYRRLAVG